MKEIKAKSYTLHSVSGEWLGQVVLTTNWMFASVTDWGNLSYTWPSQSDKDFREFLIGLNVEYFGGKLYTGMSYILHGKKCEDACRRFAERILPALKSALKEELWMEQNGRVPS